MTTNWPAGHWLIDFGSADDLAAYRLSRVLARGRTRYQDYQIIAAPALGQALILDGVLQSAGSDEVIYHEALVHPAMFAHAHPRQVAVLGGGEGAAIREVLRHSSVQNLTMIDLDEELVNLCRQLLPEFGAGAWEDPRLRLVFADARTWLAAQPDQSLDVVIMDIPDPLEGGPAFLLFTREMFLLARAKLRPTGLLSIQAGSAGQAIRLLPHLHRTLKSVFPQVLPYTAFIPSFNDLYGFFLAGDATCRWPAPERLSRIQADRHLPDLQWFQPVPPVMPPYLNRLLAKYGQVLTDAQPFKQDKPFSLDLSLVPGD
jgi:spermidine synthase